MTDNLPLKTPSFGKITEGPTDSLVNRTLEFVSSELPTWRDDPTRAEVKAEEDLNSQLCKYLNVAASERFPMVHFSHEERQTGIRRVDIAALPKHQVILGITFQSIYDPFLVVEGKRLPAPSKAREREYVTGGSSRLGGIQRFKLALHGAQQTTVAMVGYVQSGTLSEWLTRINQWIIDEVKGEAGAQEQWTSEEILDQFKEEPILRVAESASIHSRAASAVSPEVNIRHLWVAMSR
jgi:hypothetical protein